MPELALHFTLPPDADPAAVSAALQQELARVEGVESAEVSADAQRVVGPQEILVILTTATAMIGAGATAVEATAKLLAAVRHVIDETKKIGASWRLRDPRLEAGTKQVPLDAITDGDLHAAVGGG